jgi:hypothetical protein
MAAELRRASSPADAARPSTAGRSGGSWPSSSRRSRRSSSSWRPTAVEDSNAVRSVDARQAELEDREHRAAKVEQVLQQRSCT